MKDKEFKEIQETQKFLNDVHDVITTTKNVTEELERQVKEGLHPSVKDAGFSDISNAVKQKQMRLVQQSLFIERNYMKIFNDPEFYFPEHFSLTGGQVKLLSYMSTKAYGDNLFCQSQMSIANVLGQTRKTVNKNISILEKENYIAKILEYRRPRIYMINPLYGFRGRLLTLAAGLEEFLRFIPSEKRANFKRRYVKIPSINEGKLI